MLIVLVCTGCSIINNNQSSRASPPDPLLTKKLLDITAHGMADFNSVRLLVEKGANTENVLVSELSNNNDTDCRSVLYLLKRNAHLYTDPIKLNSKPKNPYINDVDNHSRKEDLAYLADTGDGKSICTEAIQYLVKLAPRLKNIQIKYDGSTSLHQYLKDIRHPDWRLDIAKLLMDKGNVNKRRFGDGFTPIHVLLLENRHVSGKDNKSLIRSIIKEIIKKGGSLNIKSNYYFDHGKKTGITAAEILSRK